MLRKERGRGAEQGVHPEQGADRSDGHADTAEGTQKPWDNNLATLEFRRGDFGLFRDQPGRVPWDKTGKRSPGKLVTIQGLPSPSSGAIVPTKQKSDKNTKRPVWKKKLLLDELQHQKEAWGNWWVKWPGCSPSCLRSVAAQ